MRRTIQPKERGELSIFNPNIQLTAKISCKTTPTGLNPGWNIKAHPSPTVALRRKLQFRVRSKMLAAIFAPPPLSRVGNNMRANVCSSYKFMQEA